MKETKTFLMMAVILFVESMFSLLPVNSCAQPVVVGEGIRFTPSNPRVGQTVFMDVRFRVEGSGAPVPINFSIVDVTRTPDPDHPTLSGRTYAPGRSFTMNIGHRIADPVSPRVCFNVYAHFPGRGLSSALLIQNACLGAQLHLASSGTTRRVVFVEGVPAGAPSGTPPGSSSTIEIRGMDFIPLNISFGKNFIKILSTIHLEGDPMFLEAHLIREMREVATNNLYLNPGNNRFDMLERVSWNEVNRIPSHLYYDIKCRRALPIRIDGEPGPTSGSPPPLQELVRGIDLETRMYVLSEGTGQRITLPGSLKILPRPGVKPAQPKL
jgi:hypothetical protein